MMTNVNLVTLVSMAGPVEVIVIDRALLPVED
jgi:hypothetical protein